MEIKAPRSSTSSAASGASPTCRCCPHFDLAPIDKSKSRLAALVKLIRRKDVTTLINACDAGREGELIFRLIVQYAEPARGGLNKLVQRLWLQSMTPQAIRDGFDKPARRRRQMQGLASAARSRLRPTGWWASTARAP